MKNSLIVFAILIIAATPRAFGSSCEHFRASDCDVRVHPGGCVAPPVLVTCRDGDPYCDLDKQCNGSCLTALCTTQLDQLCAPNIGFCGWDLQISGDPNQYQWGPGHRFYIRPVPAGQTQKLEDFNLNYVGAIISRKVRLRCLAARADCTYPGQLSAE